MKPIYLVGFMGVGKTTVGKKLSKQLNIPFLDTDEMIEQTLNMSIVNIFSTYGEEAFRQVEEETIQSLPKENVIVSTGGGMMSRKTIREHLKQTGIIIYLHCEFQEILSRLKGDQSRPLFLNKSKEELKKLFEERMSDYKKAHLIVDTTHHSAEEVINEIIHVLH